MPTHSLVLCWRREGVVYFGRWDKGEQSNGSIRLVTMVELIFIFLWWLKNNENKDVVAFLKGSSARLHRINNNNINVRRAVSNSKGLFGWVSSIAILGEERRWKSASRLGAGGNWYSLDISNRSRLKRYLFIFLYVLILGSPVHPLLKGLIDIK